MKKILIIGLILSSLLLVSCNQKLGNGEIVKYSAIIKLNEEIEVLNVIDYTVYNGFVTLKLKDGTKLSTGFNNVLIEKMKVNK